MTEALKCPDCSAPLDAPGDGSRTMRCPYCQSTVLLNGPSTDEGIDERGATIGMAIGKALEFAQINEQLRDGNKIEAIRIYRRAYGADLMTAKTAVENLAAGRNVSFSNVAASRTAASSGAKFGLLFAIFGLVMAALICVGLVVHVPNPAPPIPAPAYIPPTLQVRAPMILPTPPPALPAFAKQIMEFGSEGIGAGQFKDARSIAIDGNGHIYVGEYSGGRVQVFDSAGKFLKTWKIESKNSLTNLAVNREGTLLAVLAGKILCYEGMTGRPFGEAATTNADKQENYNDACYSLSGDIYALDIESNIIILSETGQIKRTIKAKQNTGDDEVSFDKIAVNGEGQIYTIDHKKGIFQFAPDGRYLNRFGASDQDDPTDRRPDTLHVAFNLAIDGHGRVYVGDLNPAIKVFDAGGRFLGSIADNEVCFGVAVTDQDELLSCFRNQHAIRKYVVVKR